MKNCCWFLYKKNNNTSTTNTSNTSTTNKFTNNNIEKYKRESIDKKNNLNINEKYYEFKEDKKRIEIELSDFNVINKI